VSSADISGLNPSRLAFKKRVAQIGNGKLGSRHPDDPRFARISSRLKLNDLFEILHQYSVRIRPDTKESLFPFDFFSHCPFW